MHPPHVESMIDEFGYIRSEVSAQLIAPEFDALVTEAAKRFPEALDAEFAGLFLCGSVPAGRAVAARSDLDLLLVLQAEPDEQVFRQVDEVSGELEHSHPGVVRGVDITSIWLDAVFNGDRRLAWQVLLKHMCLCIAGDEFRHELPKFAPTREVCSSLNGDAPKVFERLWREFSQMHAEHERRRIGGMIARKILFTGMSVIAAETGEWATGRADMASYLTLYYPGIATDVEFLLHACEEQELALVGSVGRLRRLSDWMAAEAWRVLHSSRST